MRAVSFRYRLECELVNKDANKIDHYFASIVMSLKDIEERPPARKYHTQHGELTILGIVARDQFAEYIDESCQELFENDKCMDEKERIGFIMMRNGQWVWEQEDGTSEPLEKVYWHIRKIGTRWGNDETGEVRRYDLKGFEEII